jgi:hypothetical protein
LEGIKSFCFYLILTIKKIIEALFGYIGLYPESFRLIKVYIN